MFVRWVQFLAVTVAALALAPSGAHLASLPAKMPMSAADYMTVQSIYAGWAAFGLLWPAGAILNLGAAVLTRRQRAPFVWSLAAAALFVVMLAVFFAWTWPANQASADWTRVPAGFMALRRQWEYSHAANAGLGFVAFCAALAAALSWREPARYPSSRF